MPTKAGLPGSRTRTVPPSPLRSSVAASTREPDPAILLKIAISKLFGSSESFGTFQSLLKREGDVCSFSNDNGRKIIFHAKGDEGADHESLIKKRILDRLSFAIPGLSFARVDGKSEEYKFDINGLDNPDVKAALQYFVNCNGENLFAAEFIASQIRENCKRGEYEDVEPVKIEYTQPKFKGAGDVAKLPQIVVKKPKAAEKKARSSQQKRVVDLLLGDTGPFNEKSIKGINYALFRHKTISSATSSSWPDSSFNAFLVQAKSPRRTLKFNKLDQIFELFIATEQMLESYNFLPDAGEANAISLASLSTRSIKTSENIFKPEVDFWSPELTIGDRIFWYNVLLRAHGCTLGNDYTPFIIESIEEGKVVPPQLTKINKWRQNWLRVNMGLVAESRAVRKLPKDPNSGPKISVSRSHVSSGRSDARELNQVIREFSDEIESYRSEFFTRDAADEDVIKRFNADQLAQFVYDEAVLDLPPEGDLDNFKAYLRARNNFGGSVAEINFKKKYCHDCDSNFSKLSQEQIGQSVSNIKGATEKLKTIKKRCRLILAARGFSENMNFIRNRFCRPFENDELQLSPLKADQVANFILDDDSLLSRDDGGYKNLVAFLGSDVDFAKSTADGNFRAKYCHGKQDAKFKELTDEQIDKSTERIKSTNGLFKALAGRLEVVQNVAQRRAKELAAEEEAKRVAAEQEAERKRLAEQRKLEEAERQRQRLADLAAQEERQRLAKQKMLEKQRLAELAVKFNTNRLLKSNLKNWRKAVAEKMAAERAAEQRAKKLLGSAFNKWKAAAQRAKDLAAQQSAAVSSFIGDAEDKGGQIALKMTNKREQDQSRFNEEQRLVAEKLAAEKAAADQRAKELAAAEKAAADQRAKELAEKLAADQRAKELAAAEKLAADQRAKELAEKLAAEEKAAADQRAKELAAAEKAAADQRAKELAEKLAADQRAKDLAAAEAERQKAAAAEAERQKLADLAAEQRAKKLLGSAFNKWKAAAEQKAKELAAAQSRLQEERAAEERLADDIYNEIVDELIKEVVVVRSLEGIDFSKGFSKMDFVKRDVKECMDPEAAKEHFKTEEFKDEFKSADKPLINNSSVPENFYTGNDGKPRQAYYSQFVAIRFEGFHFGPLDLFMSNFRNCDFKNVDFSQIPVKSFDSINFQDCTFESCKIPEGSKLATDDVRGIVVTQEGDASPYKILNASDTSKFQESQKINWQPQPSVGIDTRRSLERIGGKAEIRQSARRLDGDLTGPVQFEKIKTKYSKFDDIYL